MQIHETKGEMAYPVRFSDTRPHYRDRSILYAGIEGKDWNCTIIFQQYKKK